MKVVADASLLIALSALNRLDLLKERFPGGIIVPPSVWREVVEQGGRRPGAHDVQAAGWIRVEAVLDLGYVELLGTTLDEGEAEAIALAREQRADVVLLDEKAARTAAKQLGLRVLGVVGLLVWARRTGRLPDLRQELVRLQDLARFRLSPSVIAEALRLVDEGG